MNKNFLTKNILGLAALAVGVLLFVGFIVSYDSDDKITPQSSIDSTETTTSELEPEDNQDEVNSDSTTEAEDSDSSGETDENTSTEPTTVNEPGVSNLTATEVAIHDSATDCWTIINDQVYNITAYIPNHPGGDEVLRACGNDGATLFTTGSTESGEQVKSRGGHSTSAEVQLEAFLIGDLQK